MRPDGAVYQWRKVPPSELSVALVADERSRGQPAGLKSYRGLSGRYRAGSRSRRWSRRRLREPSGRAASEWRRSRWISPKLGDGSWVVSSFPVAASVLACVPTLVWAAASLSAASFATGVISAGRSYPQQPAPEFVPLMSTEECVVLAPVGKPKSADGIRSWPRSPHNKRLLRSLRPRWSMVPQAAVVENRRAKLLEAEQVKGPPSVQIEDANVLRAPPAPPPRNGRRSAP